MKNVSDCRKRRRIEKERREPNAGLNAVCATLQFLASQREEGGGGGSHFLFLSFLQRLFTTASQHYEGMLRRWRAYKSFIVYVVERGLLYIVVEE